MSSAPRASLFCLAPMVSATAELRGQWATWLAARLNVSIFGQLTHDPWAGWVACETLPIFSAVLTLIVCDLGTSPAVFLTPAAAVYAAVSISLPVVIRQYGPLNTVDFLRARGSRRSAIVAAAALVWLTCGALALAWIVLMVTFVQSDAMFGNSVGTVLITSAMVRAPLSLPQAHDAKVAI
jgi:hypothetical protein